MRLVAFTQQTIHGPLNLAEAPPLGILDVIGKDRRIAWQHLGSLSRPQSMEGFIDLLDRLCPQFKPYVEAIKKDKEEKNRIAKIEEDKQKEIVEDEKKKLEEQKKIEDERNREELQRRQLQDLLNQQTYHQFKAYAEKQFPGNPEQQAVLIRQLQNEHYHQYVQQLQSQVAVNNNEKNILNNNTRNNENSINTSSSENVAIDSSIINGEASVKTNNFSEMKEHFESDNEEESGEYVVINPANMWTKSDLKTFKQEVSAGQGDGVLRVGHGDTVTVRVPTNEGGASLFWEFATDSYDIGFGVYFEWGKPSSNEVSVHLSETDDEEDTVEEDEEVVSTDDLESGPPQTQTNPTTGRNPISIIVPIFRRDCQNEVYAGSHNYPGEGTYLLKFDNSYSLWRSKTLYYRVFYTR